jgi:DNA-binding NarL/FixJ family response regulator
MLTTMIVEDNLLFREMFKGDLLSQFPSMQVTEAANGEEAFRRLASHPIDLVFMDIRLPGENGLELTRKIKADYKNVTVAIVTSYDLAEYREAAVRCGADCFIAKDSMKWDQVATFVGCFQRAKDTRGSKPSCFRLSREMERRD